MKMDRLRMVALVLASLILGIGAAQAKQVSMGVVSRSSVQIACTRAGGTSFGTTNDQSDYGCNAEGVGIYCSAADSTCAALVRDTRPAVGNSLDQLLGLDRAATGVRTVQPIDPRVAPVQRAILPPSRATGLP